MLDLEPEALRRGLDALAGLGYRPRAPVEMPLDFDEACAKAVRLEWAPWLSATCVGRAHLIAMKRKAGRPQDLEDTRVLSELAPGPGEIDGE